MAATAGKAGAIYYRKAWIQATTLAIVDANGGSDTITDSGSGFVTAGFEVGDLIIVSGATTAADNFTVELTGVAAGTLTFATGTVAAGEGAGALITVQEALPGTQVLGFHNWTLDQSVDLPEITRFEDVGVEKSIVGVRRWSATADRFFETTQLAPESWLGDELTIRLFYLYDAAPNVTTVYFYEGKCLVSDISSDTDTQGVAQETYTFTGQAQASITGTGIAFVDSGPDTITDTGNGFISAGFEAGHKITVSGAAQAGNNTDFTIATVAAGTITLIASDAVTTEAASNTITIRSEVRLTTRSTAWPT